MALRLTDEAVATNGRASLFRLSVCRARIPHAGLTRGSTLGARAPRLIYSSIVRMFGW
jgi:hypothetical protein